MSAPWERFFPANPYDGFPLSEWRPDLQGWGSKDPIFAHLISAVEPQTIIEVGTWKGASAIQMAHLAKAGGLAPTIVCVDTWLGSPEHFLKRDHPAYWESLNMRNGYPQLYKQFLANVLHEGQHDVIVPLPQSSENAAIILAKLAVYGELVYIDAAHEYGAVLADLQRYWPLVTEGGVLFGDDFKHQPVADAARKFADMHGLILRATETKFAITRAGHDLPWPP